MFLKNKTQTKPAPTPKKTPNELNFSKLSSLHYLPEEDWGKLSNHCSTPLSLRFIKVEVRECGRGV